jgi:hypothetical protein
MALYWLGVSMSMTRNQFLKWVGGGTLLAACGGGGGSPAPDAAADAPAGCTASNAQIMIATNHVHSPHMLIVPKEDVAAAVEKAYDIMGTASHTHSVTVTAAQFLMLQSSASIMVTSTSGLDHTHDVTISC